MKTMGSNLLHLLVVFSIYTVQGAEYPCGANSIGTQECIQFLERNLLLLQDQVNLLSAKIDHQSNLLADQTVQLRDQSLKLESQSIQLDNYDSKFATLTTSSVSHSNQFANQSKLLSTHLANTAEQSSQLISLATQLNETKDYVTGIQSVPIGFVYVQLSNQDLPRTIWPTYYWQDITAQYAGLFFRVEGGGSAAFGVTQAENSARLTGVWSVLDSNRNHVVDAFPNNDWSAGVSSGEQPSTANGLHWKLRFRQAAGEVRPRNQAVRIWRRVV